MGRGYFEVDRLTFPGYTTVNSSTTFFYEMSSGPSGYNPGSAWAMMVGLRPSTLSGAGASSIGGQDKPRLIMGAQDVGLCMTDTGLAMIRSLGGTQTVLTSRTFAELGLTAGSSTWRYVRVEYNDGTWTWRTGSDGVNWTASTTVAGGTVSFAMVAYEDFFIGGNNAWPGTVGGYAGDMDVAIVYNSDSSQTDFGWYMDACFAWQQQLPDYFWIYTPFNPPDPTGGPGRFPVTNDGVWRPRDYLGASTTSSNVLVQPSGGPATSAPNRLGDFPGAWFYDYDVGHYFMHRNDYKSWTWDRHNDLNGWLNCDVQVQQTAAIVGANLVATWVISWSGTPPTIGTYKGVACDFELYGYVTAHEHMSWDPFFSLYTAGPYINGQIYKRPGTDQYFYRSKPPGIPDDSLGDFAASGTTYAGALGSENGQTGYSTTGGITVTPEPANDYVMLVALPRTASGSGTVTRTFPLAQSFANSAAHNFYTRLLLDVDRPSDTEANLLAYGTNVWPWSERFDVIYVPNVGEDAPDYMGHRILDDRRTPAGRLR